VKVLPAGRKTVIVEGVTYYCYGNVYFTSYSSGYVVVERPFKLETPGPEKESLTINIPNVNGSYTPVRLLKQKDGYLGPQGEYYPGHPTVEQLRVLYGR